MEDRVFTPEEVEMIRKLANTPGTTYAEVAKKFNTEVWHVRYIASNKPQQKIEKQDEKD